MFGGLGGDKGVGCQERAVEWRDDKDKGHRDLQAWAWVAEGTCSSSLSRLDPSTTPMQVWASRQAVSRVCAVDPPLPMQLMQRLLTIH